MFKWLASKVWSGFKKAVSWGWTKVVKPVVTTVASVFGVDPARTARVLETVERKTRQVVEVLETDIGSLISAALARLDAGLKRWLRATWGEVGHVLALAIERFERRLGVSDARVREEASVRVDRPKAEVRQQVSKPRVEA